MLKTASFCLRTVNYKPLACLMSTKNLPPDKQDVRQDTSIENFTTVYKFPYIRAMSIINRLKLYHSAFTAMAIPGSMALCQLGCLDKEGILITAVVGLTGCISLFTVGILANKFIGFIYLDKDESSVKIAYLDFWGRRQNTDVSLEDIVPLSELPTSLTDGLYLKLSRFSIQETLKLNLKYGQVVDEKGFKKVFATDYYSIK